MFEFFCTCNLKQAKLMPKMTSSVFQVRDAGGMDCLKLN